MTSKDFKDSSPKSSSKAPLIVTISSPSFNSTDISILPLTKMSESTESFQSPFAELSFENYQSKFKKDSLSHISLDSRSNLSASSNKNSNENSDCISIASNTSSGSNCTKRSPSISSEVTPFPTPVHSSHSPNKTIYHNTPFARTASGSRSIKRQYPAIPYWFINLSGKT